MAINFSVLCFFSSSPFNFPSSLRCFCKDLRRFSKTFCRFLWAPPRGSAIISSITPKDYKSCAVSFRASVASFVLSALRHKIDAQPSGDITEYIEC